MPLICELGWHRADPIARWNSGYYFSKCTRCGQDLVRTAYAGWQVPKGYKVVWRSTPPEQKIPFAVRDIPESQMGSDADYVEFSGKELPIQEVLRHLNARDIGADRIADGGEAEPRTGADELTLEVTRRLSRQISDALQIDRLRIGKVRIGEVRIGAATAQERPNLVAPAAETARSRLPVTEDAEPQAAGAEGDQTLKAAPDDWFDMSAPDEVPTSTAPAALEEEPSDSVIEVQPSGHDVPPEFERAAAAENLDEPSPPEAAEPIAETLLLAEADAFATEEAPRQQADAAGDDGTDDDGTDDDADAAAEDASRAQSDTPPEETETMKDPSPPAAAPPPWIVAFDAFMDDDSDVVSWGADPLPTNSPAQAAAQPASDERASEDAPLPTTEEALPPESLEAVASPGAIFSDEDEHATSQDAPAEDFLADQNGPAEQEPADPEPEFAQAPVEPEVEPVQAEAGHDPEPAPDALEEAPPPLSVAPVTEGRTARGRFWTNDPALRPAAETTGEEPRKTIPFTGQVAVGALVLAAGLGMAALISDGPGTNSASVTAPPSPPSAPSMPPQPAAQTAQRTPPTPPPVAASSKDTVPPAAAEPGSTDNDVLGAQDIWTSASQVQGQAARAATGTGFVTASILNCRKEPAEDADSIRKLSRGTSLKIVGRRTEWMNVSHRGRECWALARYISPNPSS